MNNRLFFLIAATAAISLFSACCSGKPKPVFEDGEKIVFTGELKLVGSEPMSKLVVKKDKISVILPKEMKDKLRARLWKQITVEGVVKVRVLTSVDNKHSITEYLMEEPVIK